MNWLAHPYRTFGKRLLDLSVSVPALLAVAPLFTVIATAIKLTSRGPVFFVQERLGRDGRTFRTFKFRTMIDRQRTSHPEIFGKTDEVTAVGFWLRRFKLDELPQLWNIVNGDMSLVGPRPGAAGSVGRVHRTRAAAVDGSAGTHGTGTSSRQHFCRGRNGGSTMPSTLLVFRSRLDAWIVARTVAVVVLGEERF